MQISLHKYYFDAITRARKTGERYGQAMFNHLEQVRPDLAMVVRGTEMDPFHVSKLEDPRWDAFVAFIESNWHEVLNDRDPSEKYLNETGRRTTS